MKTMDKLMQTLEQTMEKQTIKPIDEKSMKTWKPWKTEEAPWID